MLKISELGAPIAEVLNNYNHPLFEVAFQMIDDKEFYNGRKKTKFSSAVNGNNCRRVRRTNASVHEGYQET